MEGCVAVELELERVLTKLEETQNHFEEDITEQISFIQKLKEQLESAGGNDEDISENQVATLRDAINKVQDSIGRTSSEHRNLHNVVSKVGKAIDRNFSFDLGPLPHSELFDGANARSFAQVISQHLYRQGQLSIGDALCQEAGTSVDKKYKESCMEFHQILDSLKEHDLEPALKWINIHKDESRAQGSSLEFELHRLSFINVIRKGPKFLSEAITYARNNFGHFLPSYEKEIQLLMGALLHNPENVPPRYSFLFDNTLWEDLQKTFIRDACSKMGLPVESSLVVGFEAGCRAIPILHNISQTMQIKSRQFNRVWSEKDHLPVEIELGKDFHYHSMFSCPILRAQTSNSNPPMRLSCGHVISKDAMKQLTKGNKLKCPYCPGEKHASEARQLYF